MAFYAITVRTTVNVSDGGKVTIPQPIRDELEIESGDVIELDVTIPVGLSDAYNSGFYDGAMSDVNSETEMVVSEGLEEYLKLRVSQLKNDEWGLRGTGFSDE